MGLRGREIIPGTEPDLDAPPTNSTAGIEAAVNEQVDQFGQSNNTKKSYSTYTTGPTGAHKFLDPLLRERPKLGVKDHIPHQELVHALDDVPNRWSAYVILLYIGDKCCTEVDEGGRKKKKCGKSTAELIYCAWLKVWTKTGYSGEYRLDKVTGQVTGCPVKALEVKELIKSIKAREAKQAVAAYRHHAEAITIEDMKAIILLYSERLCPNGDLENPQLFDAAAVKLLDLHGFMRAFMTTAFTLFARNQETVNMKYGNLDLNAVGPAPKFRPHILLIMGERKGWIKAAGNDGSTCQAFEIFEQLEHPEMDMYTHLRRWLKYLTLRLGRDLEDSDCLFPHIAPNGAIHIKEPISYDTIADILDDFRQAAGLTKPFTTHCFRRGGAQYRFMYAPHKKRWTLNAIQWWGGWVSGEGSVDVLTRYLVDSLHTLENTYQHMLDPDRGRAIDRQAFTTGSNRLDKPASQEDVLDLQASLSTEIREFISQVLAELQHSAASATAQFYCPNNPPGSPPGPHQPSLSTARPSITTYSTYPPPSYPAPSPPYDNFDTSSALPRHPAPYTGGSHLAPIPIQPVSQPSSSLIRTANRKRPAALPIPGLYIPNLPNGAAAWRKAVEQWENGSGDILPLRDWPPEWYTGDMRVVFGSKYGQRKMIASEFNRLHRDENEFMNTYPEAKEGVSKLLTAIRTRGPPQAVGGRRRSKNGSPAERDGRRASPSESGSDAGF